MRVLRTTTSTLTKSATLFCFIVICSSVVSALAMKNVLVTGAGGKTGRLVLQKLLDRSEEFNPMGVVRTEESKQRMVDEHGVPASSLLIADIVSDAESIERACQEQEIEAIIICTSATPAPTGEMSPEGRPKFGFPNGQPKTVDWIGQKNQIDAAKKTGVQQVVVCSSMGGTNPENPLNMLGRDDNDGGNILLWKRKAEKYLIDSGVAYTIIHPGGLLDEDGGKRQLVVGIDDQQLETENRSIPRADVAALLIAGIEFDSFKNRSFDARSKPEGEGDVTTDYRKLLQNLQGNCDYSLGTIPDEDDDKSSEL